MTTVRTIEILLNGNPHRVDHGTTVLGLIQQLGLATDHVAVERNRVIVSRAAHPTTQLDAGDTLEIVTFVGGG